MTVKLHVGYVGKTRDGRRVEIVDKDPDNELFPFKANNNEWYTLGGGYNFHFKHYLDIIGPWVEPVAVKSPIETVTQNNLVDGDYGDVIVFNGHVGTYSVNTQAKLEAAIETLILIRDAKVLK